MNLVRISVVVSFVLVVLVAPAGRAEPVTVFPDEALILGPLPGAPSAEGGEVPRGEHVDVPEWSADGALPEVGSLVSLAPGRRIEWRQVAAVDGGFDLADPGIYWLVARLRVDRWTEARLRLNAEGKLYHGSDDITGATDEDGGVLTCERGWTTLAARVAVSSEGSRVALEVEADESARPVWTLERRDAFTRFGDTDQVATCTNLAVSDNGDYTARVAIRRRDGFESLDIFAAKGEPVAAGVGGAGTRAVAFSPDNETLLLKRPGTDGTDLLLYTLPSGPLETIVRDEPELGLVRFDPTGRFLLLASSRGFESGDPVDGPGRLWTRLRERVTDWTPEPHLHLIDLESGARRQLTRPGDYVLDDAVFGPEGRLVYYGRTVPIEPRPWFETELRRLDLDSGVDEKLAVFVAGWEVRPQGMAVSLDGAHLAFIASPDQVGDGHPEHNVYNKQMWIMDLAEGSYKRITRGLDLAFEGPGGLPRFDRKDRLLVQGTRGSRNHLVRLTAQDSTWHADVLANAAETLEAVSVSPDGEHVAYVASGTAEPPAVYRSRPGATPTRLGELNDDLAAKLQWSKPRKMNYTGPDGDQIEAWFYEPLQLKPDGTSKFGKPAEGSAPLVVYYYGGATPTMRGFNTTHQFFAANGYGVLVVNSRGAVGYGDAFADHHAGDWGPRSGADILAGVDHVLDKVDWLDPEAIGIYGGSYGGFMTEYLVTETDRFAAAVSMYGISDLAMYWGQGAWGWTYGDMALAGATPFGDPEYFNRLSPLYRADKVNTPLLLLHGEDDANVTPGESIQMFTALSIQNKPVAMVLFPGEGHGISGTWENRVGHRTMMLEWFDRHCKGEPEAWEARWK